MWEISYNNLMMLSATIPRYKSLKGDKKSKEEEKEVGADELANFLGLNK